MTENLTSIFPNIGVIMEGIDRYNQQAGVYSGVTFWLLIGCAAVLIGVAVTAYLKERRNRQ